MPAALVSRWASTTIPRSTASPARSARARFGRTPTPRPPGRHRAPPPDSRPPRPRSRSPSRPDGTWTPCASCSGANHAAQLIAEDACQGKASGATTWTSRPRWANEAATSRPMKLAPTTTAPRFAAARRERPAVLDMLRRAWTCGQRSAGNRPTAPVPRRSPSTARHTEVCDRREGRRAAPGRPAPPRERVDDEIDPLIAINPGGRSGIQSSDAVPARKSFERLGRSARRRRLGAHHREGTVVSLAPQHVGRGQSRGAPTDDHHGGRRRAQPGRPRLREALPHEHAIADLLDAKAARRWRPEPRGDSSGIWEKLLKAGHRYGHRMRVADDETVGERTVVVRTERADRDDAVAPANQQHIVVTHLAGKAAALGYPSPGVSAREVRRNRSRWRQARRAPDRVTAAPSRAPGSVSRSHDPSKARR